MCHGRLKDQGKVDVAPRGRSLICRLRYGGAHAGGPSPPLDFNVVDNAPALYGTQENDWTAKLNSDHPAFRRDRQPSGITGRREPSPGPMAADTVSDTGLSNPRAHTPSPTARSTRASDC